MSRLDWNILGAVSITMCLIGATEASAKATHHIKGGNVTTLMRTSHFGWPQCYATNSSPRPVAAYFMIAPSFNGSPGGKSGPLNLSGGQTMEVYSWLPGTTNPTCKVESVSKL